MSLLAEIGKGLVGMFVADARLSGAILALVAAVAVLVRVAGLPPLMGGAALLVGCHLILVAAAVREARRRS